jgi:SAM-dependent methyltransferase
MPLSRGLPVVANPFMPARLRYLRRRFGTRPFSMLDVGCGNHSPSKTRQFLPCCNYFGIDRELYNNDAADLSAMSKFLQIDLESSDLTEIPDFSFDAIVLSHVIEHLPSGLDVLRILATRKLKPGGVVYVEFPSVRSLGLPSMTGTLQFCDDPTHVRVYSVREVANLLLSQRFRILSAGRRRLWDRVILLPFAYSYRRIVQRDRRVAGIFWDLLGFADYVFAERPAANAADVVDHQPLERAAPAYGAGADGLTN